MVRLVEAVIGRGEEEAEDVEVSVLDVWMFQNPRFRDVEEEGGNHHRLTQEIL